MQVNGGNNCMGKIFIQSLALTHKGAHSDVRKLGLDIPYHSLLMAYIYGMGSCFYNGAA